MPADGISLPPKRGDFGTSRWGRLEDYATSTMRLGGRGNHRLGHELRNVRFQGRAA